MAWIVKQEACGDVDRRDLEATKIGQKGAHPKCGHTNEDGQSGLHHGESAYSLTGKSS